ncbi:YSIRK-type signal peptide-containing protein, partial [Staphylococcus haemolyticus]|uniref:YSIRK-type signal peptide-containing protein n=1 Tax=Staphylococcus haemolyticus TaxID=1283 RepID=UPI001F0A5499
MNYRDKLQKFSIRKYAVGTFSTLIATLVFLGTHTDQAHASENTNAAVEKAQQNTESQTSRDKNSNPNDAITIQNDQTSDQTVEINKQSKFVDKTSTEKKALETQTSEKEITNSTSTSIKEKIEESSPVTKEEKTNELKEKSSPIVGTQSSNQSKQKVKFSSSKSVKQIDDKIDTPRESKSDNRQKIDSKNISKLTNLTQEIQSKLLEVETIEPSNPNIEEAKKLTVESSSFTQSSNVSQQSLLDLVTRLEQTRNSLANVITRSQSGKRDPRNGQQIEKGTNFRFTTLNGRWNAGRNVIVYQRNYASLPDGRALGTGQQKNGVEGITSRKTVMRAYYKHEGNSKYLVYDVFFNNDGVNFISPGSQQRLGMALLLPYKVMKLNSDGSFASDSVRNLSYAAYEKRSGRNSLLSESPSDFIIDPDNSTQTIDMLRSNQHDFGHTTFYLSFGVRPGRSFNSDANEYFHSNRNNPDLRKAVEDQRGIFSGWNYGIGIQVDPNHPEGANRAYHMHLEVKLRDNVTTAELENAWSYANTAAMGGVSKSAYTVLSGRILPEDGALPSIENQPPVKPTINSDLVGKATTTTVIDVSTDPNTKVEIFDKNGNKIGTGTTDSSGHAYITPTRPIPEGNVTAKAYNHSDESKVSTSDPKFATDTIPPTTPVINTRLVYKAGTLTPIDVSTDPNTQVALIDKNGRIFGAGTTDSSGHVIITPDRVIPEGNVTAKATDNALHPNSSFSIPVQATTLIPVMKPVINTDVAGKAFSSPVIDITSTPNTRVELLDKNNNVIGRGITGSNGHVNITPDHYLFEGNITAKAYDQTDETNNATSDPRHVTDTTPPRKPVINTNLVNKVGTRTPIDVSTDVLTRVEIFDENGKSYGVVLTEMDGHGIITPREPLPLGKIYARATDGAETPNSIDSDHVPVTDTIPPTVPTVDTDLTGKATTKTPITVTTDPNTHVDLLDKDNHVIGSGTTDSNGRVTITPTVPIPEGNVRAKATDNAEHPNSSLSKPKKATDTTPPGSPIVNTDLTGKATTRTPVDVSSDPNTRIELLDKDNHVIGSGTTGANGHVIITPTQPIPEGNVTAKAYDNAEHPNVSTSEPKKATDTTPPTEPVVTNDLTGKATTKTPITVTTDPNTHVDLLDKDNHVIGSGTTDSNGRVTITPTVPIPEGNVRAKATDNAEHPNSSLSQPKKATDTTPPGSPIVNTDLTGKATTRTPVDVSSDPNTRIELLDKDNHVIGSGTTDSNGRVTITPTVPIPEGNVRAKATDNAEHPNSSLSQPKKATDTTPPGSPIVNTDLTGKATTKTPVDVSSDPNTRIELLDKDNHVIGTGTTGANGHVIITPTQPIPEGNVTAKAYDNAEHPNSSTSQPKKATDTTPPTEPVVTNDLTGKATTKTPITVTTDPNTHVDLLDKDNNVIGSGTTDSNGRVTITPTVPIPEGNVRAKATDNAEHPNSSLSQPKKATDTTPPGSPIVNTDLTGKATTKTPVDVSSDPNTRIELLDKDNHVIGSGTTGANGHVIITPTQPIPEGNVTAKAYDNAEHPNVSTSEPKKATDTTPPTAPVVTSDLTGKSTTTDPVEVTTDPNTKVELLDKDGNVIGSGTTDNTGHVMITPTKPIPEGNVTAKAYDNAEHPNSSTSQPKKATDTTPPTAPVVTSDLTGKSTTTDPVEVTTDPNTKVELLDKDGNVIGSGTTDNTGHVTITPTKPIPEGNVTAKATDNAEHPNSSTSQPKKATDTTPPTAPLVTSDLTGEATTTDPVEVTTDPNTKVELLDKDGNVIGSGTTDNTGHVTITPTKPIPEGNVTAKAYDNAEHPNSSTSQPKKATDTTPPTAPVVTSDLTGKATTTDPVEVTTDPNTKVELLDKDGNVIGSGTTDNTGHVTITPTKPIPEGNVTAKATDNAEHPNSSTSQPKKATDTTPPTAPLVTSDLTGKATTTDPVEVTTDPNTKVELLDKDGNVIGSGTTDNTGHVMITPTKPIPEGNVTAKAYDNAEHPNSSTSQPKKATDTTPPTAPVVTSDLTGKATTTDPVEVTTDPNTKVELLDKDGNVIGSGTTDNTGHVMITPTKPIPEGNVTAKAYDNAEHPNSSTSQPKKATDTTPPTAPVVTSDLTGKATTTDPV